MGVYVSTTATGAAMTAEKTAKRATTEKNRIMTWKVV